MVLDLCAPPAGDASSCQRLLAQPRRRIVGAQRKPIFGARGHHPIGLAHALKRQIVDHHADVGWCAGRTGPRPAPVQRPPRSVPPTSTLRRRFLIAGGAVDLPGQEQAGQLAHLQRLVEPPRIDEFIFDRIAGPGDRRPLEAGDACGRNASCTSRGKRCRDAIRIDERIVQAFGLEENLVGVALGEALHLVLDRRAVTRPPPLDRAGEQGRPVEIGADDVVRPRVGPGDRAAQLRRTGRRRRAPTSSTPRRSLGCSSSRAQSIVRPSSRGGVPVFSRPCPSRSRESGRQAHRGAFVRAGRLRPPARQRTCAHRGTCPVAITTARHGKRADARLHARPRDRPRAVKA